MVYDDKAIIREWSNMVMDLRPNVNNRVTPQFVTRTDDYDAHVEMGVMTLNGRRVLQVCVSCRVLEDWPEVGHEKAD